MFQASFSLFGDYIFAPFARLPALSAGFLPSLGTQNMSLLHPQSWTKWMKNYDHLSSHFKFQWWKKWRVFFGMRVNHWFVGEGWFYFLFYLFLCVTWRWDGPRWTLGQRNIQTVKSFLFFSYDCVQSVSTREEIRCQVGSLCPSAGSLCNRSLGLESSVWFPQPHEISKLVQSA